MTDRGFTEIDLRRMLGVAVRRRPDIEAGRWIIETWHDRQRWEIIVEPDDELRQLVVITAYPVDGG